MIAHLRAHSQKKRKVEEEPIANDVAFTDDEKKEIKQKLQFVFDITSNASSKEVKVTATVLHKILLKATNSRQTIPETSQFMVEKLSYNPNEDIKSIAETILLKEHIIEDKKRDIDCIFDDFWSKLKNWYNTLNLDDCTTLERKQLHEIFYAMQVAIQDYMHLPRGTTTYDLLPLEFEKRKNTLMILNKSPHPCAGACVSGFCRTDPEEIRLSQEHFFSKRKMGKHFLQQAQSPENPDNIRFDNDKWKQILITTVKKYIIPLCHSCATVKTAIFDDTNPSTPCGCAICEVSLHFRWIHPDFKFPDPNYRGAKCHWMLYPDGSWCLGPVANIKNEN